MKTEKESRLLIPKEAGFFKDLFDEHYAQLVRFSEAIVFNKEEAKDLVQEVFCSLWDKAGKLQIESAISGYLYTAVKNKSLNHIKARKIRDENHERINEAALHACIAAPEESEELFNKIHTLIDEFPAQIKKIIRLRLETNMKYSEIASHLQLSKNTVKTHLRIAFSQLRKKMLVFFSFF